ncbi:WecB/TagA/CpsF family glycosyltransferase [Sulfitobacter sp. W074]|uniref:WecB/TagA/CpsF family glycosyltransferase n=1 Tax=Sulfitobacter sp. W074 TaxID=2867026 RepID=UPI0021A42DA5|nr:WecB/TagA/CpsF family glycosyltransferase [Sulfitobacter sp. W074]UWR39648.1 WecB/TagA/CpsF family glycosyltransferase [Sulfitobacter sp. W074]
MRIRDLSPDIQAYHHLARLSGAKVMTINLQVFYEVFQHGALSNPSSFRYSIDSRIIAAILRVLTKRRVQVITGSDMTEEILIGAIGGIERVLVIGSVEEDVPKLRKISKVDKLDVLPITVDSGGAAEALSAALEEYSGNRYDVILVALGCPKQERFIDNYEDELSVFQPKAIVGVGASIDFLTGRQRRAPRLVRKLALEWLWRAVSTKGHLVKVKKSLISLGCI